jgi:hypothetical protein
MFCSLCLKRFNKTDKIDIRGFPSLENPTENPLAVDGGQASLPSHWWERARHFLTLLITRR